MELTMFLAALRRLTSRGRLLGGLATAVVVNLFGSAAIAAAPPECTTEGTGAAECTKAIPGSAREGSSCLYNGGCGATAEEAAGTLLASLGAMVCTWQGPQESPFSPSPVQDRLPAFVEQSQFGGGYSTMTWDILANDFTCREPLSGSYTGTSYRWRELRCPSGDWSRKIHDQNVYCVRTPDCPGDDCPKTRARESVGNPIQALTGAKLQRVVDYEGAGEFPLRFERTYRSSGHVAPVVLGNPPVQYEFGLSWTHNYFGVLTYFGPDGRNLSIDRGRGPRYYRLSADNTKLVPSGNQRDEVRPIGAVGSVTGFTRIDARNHQEIYDILGRLRELRDGKGNAHVLHYQGSSFKLLSVSDGFGRAIEFQYGSEDRITGIRLPDGRIIQYLVAGIFDNYFPDEPEFRRQWSVLSSVTYPDGKSIRYGYDGLDRLWLSSVTDERGLQVGSYTRTLVAGHIERATTENAGGVNRFEIQPANGIGSTTITGPLGERYTQTFADFGGITRLTSQTECAGSTPNCSERSMTYTYKADGRLASERDWNGVETTYTIDPSRKLETARVEAAGTPVARKTTTGWASDSRLRTRETVYDPSNTAVFQRNWSYDTNGRLTQYLEKDLVAPKTRRWAYTHTYSAAAPWARERTVVNGPRTDVADTTTTDFWAFDATCPDQLPIAGVVNLGCRGNARSVTDALGRVTTYDAYDHNGRLLQQTDPNGRKTRYRYHVRGWLTSVAEIFSGQTLTTTLTYLPNGRLSKVTQPDGSYFTLTYDAAQRLTAMADASGNKVTYTLDAAGNRIGERTRDSSGTLTRRITRTFDGLSRLTSVLGALQ